MEILTLFLEAFGPFTGERLELVPPGSRGGLHVIYGGNESGKSSARRALGNFFFKIPGQTDDNFLHEYRALRIGLGLRFADGTERELYRRKGNKRTLTDSEGLVSEELLQAALGGLTGESFLRTISLDAADLEAGAQDLLSGGGNLGQALFAASLGSRQLRELQTALDRESDSLFQARGRSRPLNAAINEVVELRRQAEAVALRSDEWNRLSDELAHSEAELHSLRGCLRENRARRSRLERVGQAIPLLARRRQLEEEQLRLGAAALPDLRTRFVEQRRHACAEASRAEHEVARLEGELERSTRSLETLRVPDELLGRADQLIVLQEQAGAQRDLRLRLVLLGAEVAQTEADAERLRAVLEPGRDLEEVLARVPHPVARERLDRIGEQLLAERNTHEQKRLALEKALAGLGHSEASREEAERAAASAPLALSLQRAAERAQRAGEVDEDLAAAERQAAALYETLEARVLQLPRTSMSLEVLLGVAFPDLATIETHRSGLMEVEARCRRLRERSEELASERRSVEGRLRTLELAQDVPTEGDLLRSRSVRDSVWELVRAAWREGRSSELLVPEVALDRPLADAYEERVVDSDEVSDRLRREAKRVASKAELQVRLTSLVTEEAQVEVGLAEAEGKQAEETLGWRDLWVGNSLEVGTPEEMLSWTQSVAALREAAGVWRHGVQEVERHLSRRRELTAELRVELADLGLTQAGGERLAPLLDMARDQVEARRKLHGVAEHAREKVAERRLALEELEFEAQRAETNYSNSQRAWLQACVELDLDPKVTPAEARARLHELQTLRDLVEQCRAASSEIQQLESDQTAFEQSARDLLSGVAPDLAARPSLAALEEIGNRLGVAREGSGRREALSSARATVIADLAAARVDWDEASVNLAELCREAGVASASDLPQLEARVQRVAELRERLADCEEALCELSAGGGLEALAAEAAGLAVDEIPVLLEELQHAQERLEGQRSLLEQTLGALRGNLEAHDGSAEAVRLEELARAKAAELQVLIDRWVELRAARALLNEQIERYAAEHRGPLLERASALFERLTRGSFVALVSEASDREPELLGQRRDNERVAVRHMSAGTREQLYLSLRIASLEVQEQAVEVLPLIVDDVLLHSDEDRSRAILEVLTEVSTRRQVLFFTHSRRLRELAGALESPQVSLHCLGAVPATPIRALPSESLPARSG